MYGIIFNDDTFSNVSDTIFQLPKGSGVNTPRSPWITLPQQKGVITLRDYNNAWEGRAYTWSLVTYAKEEERQRLLDEAKHWAYAVHDKDSDQDGELIEPHTHIIATFEQQVSIEKIKKILGSDQNTFGECRRKCGSTWVKLNISELFRYLLHRGYEDKYQYDDEVRVIDSILYWRQYENIQGGAQSDNETFLKDLLSMEYEDERDKIFKLACKYGRDYIKNIRIYTEFANMMLAMERKELDRGDIQNNRESITKLSNTLFEPMEEGEEGPF